MKEHAPTVFVVDDDEAVRGSLRLLLKSVGLAATTLPTAQEFLAKYAPEQPGCLVLDVRMPGMSGLELQEQLNVRGAIIPVIFITGHGDIPMAVEAMQQGAFGISTALIYPPGHYAKTDELVELAKVVGQYGGIYATHMRSEGQSEVAAIDEALHIGREAHVPVEIFHLKVIGKSRWGSMPKVIAKIQAARDSGQDVSADMYPYVAGGTALAASLPPWVADGGEKKLLERLHDPATRTKIKQELRTEHADWENLFLDSGGGAGVLVAGIQKSELKKFDGKTSHKLQPRRRKILSTP